MWPSSYFCPQFWAPTYWARPGVSGTGGPGPGQTYPNLHAAIIARCESTPDLALVCTGGFWTGVAGPRTQPPYAVLSDVASSFQFTTGMPFVRTVRLQMSFFATQADTLKSLRKAFVRAFNPRMVPLLIEDQAHVVLQPSGEGMGPFEGQDQAGRPLHMQIIELTAIVSAEVA